MPPHPHPPSDLLLNTPHQLIRERVHRARRPHMVQYENREGGPRCGSGKAQAALCRDTYQLQRI